MVVFGGFYGYGQQFSRINLAEGGDLLDSVNLVLEHVGKLITS